MKLGLPEKSILAFFIVILAIIIIIANLLFQCIGLGEAFIVPFWQLLLFAAIAFIFLVYLMDKTAELKTIITRAGIMFIILVFWSFLQGLLVFLASEDKDFQSCIAHSFTSLPIFLLSMTFVILIGFMYYKLFSTPFLRTLATPDEETQVREKEELIERRGTSEEELTRTNPFEFHPDPSLSFEELPGFFTRKVKGLIGCVIFDASEGLTLASALPPGFDNEFLSAIVTSIIDESKNLRRLFTSREKTPTNTMIFIPQRIIAFSAHQDYPILLIFDDSVSPAYVRRALETLPETIKEFTRVKTFSTEGAVK